MGGSGRDQRRISTVSFPVPLPPSFVASFALPLISLSSFPTPSVPPLSAESLGTLPLFRNGGAPDVPEAKRRRMDIRHPAEDGLSRRQPQGSVTPHLSERPSEPAEQQGGGVYAKGERTPDAVPTHMSAPVTRLQRRTAAADRTPTGREAEEQPHQQQHQQQQQQHAPSRQGRQQFATAVTLLQSLPIWRRHPDSIPALVKAASEAAAARQRRAASRRSPQYDSMLDGEPFISATIHWEAKRQAVCVKAFKDRELHSSCRYFPLNRLSPEEEGPGGPEGPSPLPQRRRMRPQPGDPIQMVCPQRLLFAAYVFFLQLPLSPSGPLRGTPRAHMVAPLSERFRTAGGPSGAGDIVRGPRGPSSGLPEGETSRRVVASTQWKERLAGTEAGGSMIAAEALASAAVAAACLSAAAANKQQQQQQQQQQQRGASIATVLLLSWSFLPPQGEASLNQEAAAAGRLHRQLQHQQQHQQQQQQQQQQQICGETSGVSEQPLLQREAAESLLSIPGSAVSSDPSRVETLTCR